MIPALTPPSPKGRGRSIILLAMTISFINITPSFASPQEELSKTQKEAEAARADSKKLALEAKRLAKKKAELSAQMVKTASALQVSEARLSAIEENLRKLDEQITEKTNNLTANKKQLAVMVQASVKLSHTPPESIIIMPGDAMDNMKASRALKMTTDSIKVQSESIRNQMNELSLLKEKATKSQQEAVAEREELEKQRTVLKTQIEQHNALQKKLSAAQKEARARVQSLAKKASDLQELIISLEKEKKQDENNEDITSDNSEPAGEKGRLRSFKSAKGHIRVPAAGKLVQRYGAEGRNETSKGITIATRANAQVTSPYDAEVLFTGPFMDYGKVVILRHSDGFHTLLAGIAKIDISVGDFLLEGEPIGAMGDSDSNNRLYMELRLDSQPIDPANWIRGMNK